MQSPDPATITAWPHTRYICHGCSGAYPRGASLNAHAGRCPAIATSPEVKDALADLKIIYICGLVHCSFRCVFFPSLLEHYAHHPDHKSFYKRDLDVVNPSLSHSVAPRVTKIMLLFHPLLAEWWDEKSTFHKSTNADFVIEIKRNKAFLEKTTRRRTSSAAPTTASTTSTSKAPGRSSSATPASFRSSTARGRPASRPFAPAKKAMDGSKAPPTKESKKADKPKAVASSGPGVASRLRSGKAKEQATKEQAKKKAAAAPATQPHKGRGPGSEGETEAKAGSSNRKATPDSPQRRRSPSAASPTKAGPIARPTGKKCFGGLGEPPFGDKDGLMAWASWAAQETEAGAPWSQKLSATDRRKVNQAFALAAKHHHARAQFHHLRAQLLNDALLTNL